MARKYNIATDGQTGDKVMLFLDVEGKKTPIAFGTSCSLDMSADTIDTSNKMSGNWKEFLTGQLGYTVASESLLSFKEGDLSFDVLMKMMASRKPIPFVYGKAKSDTAGDFPIEAGYYEGEGIITALSQAAQVGAICTASCTLQGNGELKQVAGVAPAQAPAQK